jgi:ankyrin repeat protein
VSIPDNGLTPLGMAIKHRHLSIAEYLIDKGANVNAINKVIILIFKPSLDKAINLI